MNALSTHALALGALLLSAPLAPALGAEGPPSLADRTAQVDQLAGQLRGEEDNLRFVETQYTERLEPSREEARLRRFSDGEIQYLLGDWAGASVLFYDLVSDPSYKDDLRYGRALHYLADALYQQGNFIGARLYLRELLNAAPSAQLPTPYKDVLARYLEVAGKLNDFTGIEGYLAKAQALSGGKLSPELAYVYGKWMMRRRDLAPAERETRARVIFGELVEGGLEPYRSSSLYHLAVIEVQAGQYAKAIERFRALADGLGQDASALKVRELANLSLGRLLHETGRYGEALDRYGRIPRESSAFVDSLYEVAWTYVKKGELTKAKNTTDILLLLAPDSTLAPDVRLLQGHLLLKLKRYGEAGETYRAVVEGYAPVRDGMGALLRAKDDPITYFDYLLAQHARRLDTSHLLPPLALKYASTEREVADALQLMGNLQAGREGVSEANEIAERVLKALDERGLEAFPALQEGYTRAAAVDTAVSQAELKLNGIEHALLAPQLSPLERAQLGEVTRERESLKARFAALPTSMKEVDARFKRMHDRVDEVDREAFKLGHELQSLTILAQGVEKWARDTRGTRKTTAQAEDDFAAQLQHENNALEGLKKELAAARAELSEVRNSARASGSGEDALRKRFAELLRREHGILALAEGRAAPAVQTVLKRTHAVRDTIAKLHARALGAQAALRSQVQRRGKSVRDRVVIEQRLLKGYGSETETIAENARALVGRIAHESFQRVHQQFYDLVLKADLGVVDVGFKRKQDRTEDIQLLSAHKERDLRLIDKDFAQALEGGE